MYIQYCTILKSNSDWSSFLGLKFYMGWMREVPRSIPGTGGARMSLLFSKFFLVREYLPQYHSGLTKCTMPWYRRCQKKNQSHRKIKKKKNLCQVASPAKFHRKLSENQFMVPERNISSMACANVL